MAVMRVAVVGATGAVGRTMLRILEERGFPADELVPLASERTAGSRVSFAGRDHTVGVLTQVAPEGVGVAPRASGSSVAKTWVPAAGGAAGAVGASMLRILEERGFPADEHVPLASERTAGSRVSFAGRDHAVGVLTQEALEGVDVALSSCGSSVAKTWVPAASEAG